MKAAFIFLKIVENRFVEILDAYYEVVGSFGSQMKLIKNMLKISNF